MTIRGCFKKAVQNVHYICHVVSPLATNADPKDTDFETTMIKPAVQGTLNILEAAAKAPKVKRISITSSLFGLIPWQSMAVTESPTVFNAESRASTPDHTPENLIGAYGLSKISALNAAQLWVSVSSTPTNIGCRGFHIASVSITSFSTAPKPICYDNAPALGITQLTILQVKQHNPHFDIIHVHPNYVLGRNDLLTTFSTATRGTNNNVLSAVLGDQTPTTAAQGRFAGGSGHVVDDVARI